MADLSPEFQAPEAQPAAVHCPRCGWRATAIDENDQLAQYLDHVKESHAHGR